TSCAAPSAITWGSRSRPPASCSCLSCRKRAARRSSGARSAPRLWVRIWAISPASRTRRRSTRSGSLGRWADSSPELPPRLLREGLALLRGLLAVDLLGLVDLALVRGLLHHLPLHVVADARAGRLRRVRELRHRVPPRSACASTLHPVSTLGERRVRCRVMRV